MEDEPFDVITIDLRFKVGERRQESARGKEILRIVKQNYPHIACIMISGEGWGANNVLDLRDNYDLDYYIQKDRLDIDLLEKAVSISLNRVGRTLEVGSPEAPETPVSPPLPSASKDTLQQQITYYIETFIAHGDFHGGNSEITNGLSAQDAAELFEKIYAAVDNRPDTESAEIAEIKATLQAIQSELQKDLEDVNKSFLVERLTNLKKMAPDILEVAITTFSNPGAGIASIAAKIAEKVKEDASD